MRKIYRGYGWKLGKLDFGENMKGKVRGDLCRDRERAGLKSWFEKSKRRSAVNGAGTVWVR